MFKKTLPVSPSGMDRLTCLKRYKTEVLDGHRSKQAFSRPAAFGTALHRALEKLYDPRINGRFPEFPSDDMIRRAVLLAFRQPVQAGNAYPDGDTREEDIERAVPMLKSYLAAADWTEQTVAVERMESRVFNDKEGSPQFRLTAKLDRLLVRPDELDTLVLRDYKTGVVEGDDGRAACIQLAVAFSLFKKEFRQFTAEFDYLGDDGLRFRKTFNLADVRPAWSEVSTLIHRALAATAFPAEPGDCCQYCPIINECQPERVSSVSETELDELFG